MVLTPTQRIVFEDEVLQIEINVSLSLLQLTWQQQPTSEQYRRGYRQAIYLALEYKTRLWLTDSRKVAYLHWADQHWMYAKMRPWLKGGKLLKFAIVIQAETWLMTDLKPVYNYLEPTAEPRKEFNLEFFLDLEAAQSWLLAENPNF
jgi:hypothetical protein